MSDVQKRHALVATMCAVLAGCTAGGSPDPSARPVSVVGLPYGSELPSGRYVLPFEGLQEDGPVAEVEVPTGYAVFNESVLWAVDDRPARGLLFWNITGVTRDPCHGLPRFYDDPGPSVEDLATALRAQRFRRGSPPRPVTFAGHDGLYLELTFPPGFDPADCASGHYEAWRATVADSNQDRWQYGPGYVDRIWVLDVDGTRLVVNATYDGRIGARDAEALEDMVRSVRFVAGPA